MEDSQVEKTNVNRGYRFPKGVSGNPNGRPLIPSLRNQIKKKNAEILAQYEKELIEALPKIKPALIKQAVKGSLGHIQEVHKVVGAHKRTEGNITAVQINIGDDREAYA